MLKPGYQEDHVYITVDAAHYLAQAGLKWSASTTCRSTAPAPWTSPPPRAPRGRGRRGRGADLSEVEPGEYEMACLPLRVGGGDAAPARVVLRSRG